MTCFGRPDTTRYDIAPLQVSIANLGIISEILVANFFLTPPPPILCASLKRMNVRLDVS